MGASCNCTNYNYSEFQRELDMLKEQKKCKDFFIDSNPESGYLLNKDDIQKDSKPNAINTLNSNNNDAINNYNLNSNNNYY